MTRIALKIAYDGTAYAGWQRQHNALSVQQVVETALFALTGQPTVLFGASRTDAGVHARGQVAHFDTAASVPAERYAHALNSLLPDDVKVMASSAVDEAFHARFDARHKTYRYNIDCGQHPNPLTHKSAWHVHTPLDVSAMRQAVQSLCGTHDFAAFAAVGGSAKTTVRTVNRAGFSTQSECLSCAGFSSPNECLIRTDFSTQDELLTFEINGNAFLYNMVRIAVGTLVWIGRGKLPPNAITQMLQTKQRVAGGPTAPPQGLVLWEIGYGRALFGEYSRAS